MQALKRWRRTWVNSSNTTSKSLLYKHQRVCVKPAKGIILKDVQCGQVGPDLHWDRCSLAEPSCLQFPAYINYQPKCPESNRCDKY